MQFANNEYFFLKLPTYKDEVDMKRLLIGQTAYFICIGDVYADKRKP